TLLPSPQQSSSIATALIICVVVHGLIAGILYLANHREAYSSSADQASAIQLAAQENDAAKVERLLNSGVNPDAKDSFGDTPLINNVNQTDIVRILLKHH